MLLVSGPYDMLFPGSFSMKFFCVLQSKATLKYHPMQAGGIRWLSCDLCLGGEKVAEVFALVVHFHTVIMELLTINSSPECVVNR